MINCTDIENKIVDCIDGSLSPKESEIIKNHISTCNTCQKIHEETILLMSSFTNEPIVKPSAKLKASFEQMLAKEKKAQSNVIPLHTDKKNSFKSILQIAASIAILLTGYILGGYQESKNYNEKVAEFKNEQKELKEKIMLAMLDNSSPSTRIKAVNYTDKLYKPDTKILTALIERMQQDSNSNVRLSAAEALSKFTDSELVRKSFIESLISEKDPSIKIEIIQILVNIQEKRALDPMKKLLEQPEQPNYLKTQVNIGIAKLI